MTYNTDRDQMSTALAQYIAKYAGERGGKGKQKTELQDAASIHSESRLEKNAQNCCHYGREVVHTDYYLDPPRVSN